MTHCMSHIKLLYQGEGETLSAAPQWRHREIYTRQVTWSNKRRHLKLKLISVIISHSMTEHSNRFSQCLRLNILTIYD